jgi:enoyl-CoA hydratase/carnithine racemase
MIGIDRPKADNRIDPDTFTALGAALYRLDHDDAMRVALLHARGTNFCPGLDLAAWASRLRSGPFQPGSQEFINPLGAVGPRRAKPLVVAVQGTTRFIGHELFLAADVRVAASDTVFGQGEVHNALFPAGGATVRFPREAGWGNAMRYMLTGEDWGAEEALRLGLAQAVAPPGRQLERALELASKIARAAPLGVRAMLASAHQAQAQGEDATFASLGPELAALFKTDDFQERLHAQQENRSPVYRGR